jgi:hypothetical protein
VLAFSNCCRFIKELGHTEINQLKTSVSELKDGFSNLEISFKKVGPSSLSIELHVVEVCEFYLKSLCMIDSDS